MIRIAENDLGAEVFQIAMRDGLHRTLGADRHERGCIDGAMRRLEHAAPRRTVRVSDSEVE